MLVCAKWYSLLYLYGFELTQNRPQILPPSHMTPVEFNPVWQTLQNSYNFYDNPSYFNMLI